MRRRRNAVEDRVAAADPLVDGPETESGGLPLEPGELTSGRTVLGGSVWYAASRLVPQAYTLVISIAAARFLGPDGMGRQSFIAFVALSVTMALSGGFFISVLRHVGEVHGGGGASALKSLVRWAWTIVSVAALVGGAAVAAVGVLGADPRSAWVLAGVAVVVGTVNAVPTAVLQGLQLWRAASLIALVGGFGSTAATIGVLAAGGGITGMFAVEAVAGTATLLCSIYLARRALAATPPGTAPVGDLRRRTARFAAIASIDVLLALVVWRRFELFALDKYSSDAEIAIYSIAYAAVTALIRIPDAVSSVLTPAIATLYGAGEHGRIQSGFSRALRLMVLFTLPIVAAALALGPQTVLLAYGGDYDGIQPVLLLMLAFMPLVPVIGLCNAVLQGIGEIRVPVATAAVAAAVDIGLAFALVPHHEAVGAAIANSAAMVVMAVPIVAYTNHRIGRVRWELPSVLKTAIASGLGGAAAWGVSRVVDGAPGIVLGLGVGAAVFAVLASLLRVLPSDDAVWLDETAGTRLGGIVGRACRLWSRPPAEARS